MRDGRSKEDRELVDEMMHYPKETIIQAFMHVAFYNREQLAIELLFAEWKRQSDMLNAENARFAKITPMDMTMRRWRYHYKRVDMIQARIDDLDKKINEKLRITKGEENGSVIGGRGGVRPGQRDDGRAGSLASKEAAGGGGC